MTKRFKQEITFIEVKIRVNEEVHRFKEIFENQYILTLRKLGLSQEDITNEESKYRKKSVMEKNHLTLFWKCQLFQAPTAQDRKSVVQYLSA